MMRTPRFLISLVTCIAFCLTASASYARTSARAESRHSYLVMNAETGDIIMQENADAIRYPASLTKMMTLYLTFEALKKGVLKLDQKLPVSAKAARQPQTNLSLRRGDKISVRDAIVSLVVRSANDAAMVLGEALGKTEFNFGVMMTTKARRLGMTNTIFRNPSGLPDSKQHSTARDMAILGVALRKHFPEYYHYFKTQNFTYKGRFYPGHNRVMSRYQGVDGIKTGYINASGFNLVTSVKRNGYTLVGVVMGGRTYQARDNEMISLLDRSFTQLASRKDKNRYAQKGDKIDIAAIEASAPSTSAATAAEMAAVAPAASGGEIDSTTASVDASSEDTLGSGESWGIQIGAYQQAGQAMEAATKAKQQAKRELSRARVAVDDGAGIHRARLLELSEKQAKSACKRILSRGTPCFVYHTGQAS